MLLDCDAQGIFTALYLAIVSFMGNQTTYTVATRRFANVRARNEIRQ
jgi:hypothetical protein